MRRGNAGVLGGLKSVSDCLGLDMGAGTEPSPLPEQFALLAAEPSLQSLLIAFEIINSFYTFLFLIKEKGIKCQH